MKILFRFMLLLKVNNSQSQFFLMCDIFPLIKFKNENLFLFSAIYAKWAIVQKKESSIGNIPSTSK